MLMKMWCLTIIIKRNDEHEGKRTQNVLMDYLRQAGISGATVWTGVDGFGKRGKSTVHMEGVSVNMPLVIEVIDEKEKLEPLLSGIKRIVDDNGLMTLHDVNVF